MWSLLTFLQQELSILAFALSQIFEEARAWQEQWRFPTEKKGQLIAFIMDQNPTKSGHNKF